jgi:hypothetical protein
VTCALGIEGEGDMQLPLPPSSTGETGHTGEQVLQQADGDPHFNLVISNHIWHKRKSNRNRKEKSYLAQTKVKSK